MITILGIPSDENSSFMKGAAEAPAKIRAELFSNAYNMWTETGVNLGEPSLLDDAGDLSFPSTQDPWDIIESGVSRILHIGAVPILLGGDHAITPPILRAFRRRYPKLNLLHFDAHPDIYDEFEGNRRSHACPFARIMEEKLVDRLVSIGIRTATGHQREQIRKFGVEAVEMKDWRDDRKFEFDGPVYISLDMDGLDPAFAPGVSHREPGGLSPRQVINIIQSLRSEIVGADIVEYNPRQDAGSLTATVAAKLLKEIAGCMLRA